MSVREKVGEKAGALAGPKVVASFGDSVETWAGRLVAMSVAARAERSDDSLQSKM